MSDKLYFRGGLAANRPILSAREPGFDTDTKEFFIGTGSVNQQISAPYDKISSFRASQGAGQAISAGAFTKITFSNELHDNQNEYDTATYRFTALKAGVYAISAGIYFSTQTNLNNVALALYRNGVVESYLSQINTTSTGTMQASGSVLTRLAAGDYLEIYALLTLAASTIGTTSGSYFMGTKLAH